MKSVLYTLCFVFVCVFVAGCSHNINVQGFGIATPYGAMGYGTFTCAKENTTTISEEVVNKDGTLTTANKFTVGAQITGAYVDAIKNGANQDKLNEMLKK